MGGEEVQVKLLVLPDDGLAPLLLAIRRAKKTIRIVIFRCDIQEIPQALEAAVARGVLVHALVAHTNRGGEKLLRTLELQLLAAGVTVSRTGDDLVRYHHKVLVVDERQLFVLGFNYTHRDLTMSRSMGIETRQRRLVAEAIGLFDADAMRQPFSPSLDTFVVSPLNARARLAALIKSAKRELLIYDPRIADWSMIRLLKQRSGAGVDVRIIGGVGARGAGLRVAKLKDRRLHLRAISSDGRQVFIGSQSLRALELDRRREVGLIIRDTRVLGAFRTHFEADWATTEIAQHEAELQRKRQDEPEPAIA
jgi:cardiolipin synthase